MNPSDLELASYLEGLLEPEDTRRVEASLTPERRRRLEAIEGVIGDPVLPAVEPPPGLLERTLARLESEGLIGDPALPAGLHEGVLGYLEREGLAPPARAVSIPARGASPWRVAATLVAGLGLGAVLGWNARGPETVTVEKPVDRVVERIVERVVEKPVDRVVERIVERVVEKPVDRVVEKPVERVVERVVERQVERIPSFVAEGATDAEMWSEETGRWAPLRPGATLAPAEIVRASAARGELIVGRVRTSLDAGLYVVSRDGRVAALPTEGSSPKAEPIPSGDLSAETLGRLVERRARGSSTDLVLAQAQLTRAWERIGTGGSASTLFAGGGDAPPNTAEGWERWWRRVDKR